ncbi:hypothetical protein ES703_47486 [subsurface metagenome]
MYLSKRDKPITNDEESEFWETHGHLAYRYTMLLTHKEKVDNEKQIEYCMAICSFEAALLACRVFMEFLGLGIKYKPDPVLVEKRDYFSMDGSTTNEVKVIDLGGSFVSLTELMASEQSTLATVYHMAHKATAHFTFGAPYMSQPEIVHSAVAIIDRMLHKHLYHPLGACPKRHWQ